MLLVHQTGSVKLGEVVRYTLTYTPSQDRIVPTAPNLYVKVRNTCAVALRAAYLHGPYTLYASCHPATFKPNEAHGHPDTYGFPQFEPNLKAGGSWTAPLKVPDDIRETFVAADNRRHSLQAGGSVTWIIEISSQMLFSANSAVHYEVLVGRDEKAVDLGFINSGGALQAAAGVLADFLERRRDMRPDVPQAKGVYTKAIHLTISDTGALWNTPQLPGADQERQDRATIRKNPVLDDGNPQSPPPAAQEPEDVEKLKATKTRHKEHRQKIHLVLITHGLHSNLGADMLYLKESIDAAAKQARMDRTMRKAKLNATAATETEPGPEATPGTQGTTETSPGGRTDATTEEADPDADEQVIVRGFPGNAVKTEKGIQYLGKRLAKYVLAMTYPDQPYVPVKKRSMTRSLTSALGVGDKLPPAAHQGHEAHHHSTIRKEPIEETSLAYQITSISFIGHSLGGLVQTYAIAYIQKHSPEFFQLIKPINFIALASPFLGLSNENPLYVKFALDFGLVGRTGQDLGLTWRAPTVVRSGWGAMIAGIGSDGHRRRNQMEPGSKPLLRILPSGPAHQVLRLFRNRTVYSNVVNDGIVPLRTSCLLFLDWRGLDRVDKARRENGLVGTMAGWGWAEITGQNSSDQQSHVRHKSSDFDSGDELDERRDQAPTGAAVPQPDEDAIADHTNVSAPSSPIEERRASLVRKKSDADRQPRPHSAHSHAESGSSSLSSFLAMLKPSGGSGGSSRPKSKSPSPDDRSQRIYKRSQTIKFDDEDPRSPRSPASPGEPADPRSPARPGMARGDSALQEASVVAPPKTSVFESAGDILNPPIPTREYLTEPLKRPRTIFHDRVYHPEDIPAPLMRPRSFFSRSTPAEGRPAPPGSADTQDSYTSRDSVSSTASTSNMKVEEKIARAYHRDLSWRKVLVRLEPDAHNNIVVRRMFSNAYGWPVVQHLVDTHFADSPAAGLPDTEEAGLERAKPMNTARGASGEVRAAQRRSSTLSTDGAGATRDMLAAAADERRDSLGALPETLPHHTTADRPRMTRQDSAQWDDRFFESDDDDDDDDDEGAFSTTRSPRQSPGGGDDKDDNEQGLVAHRPPVIDTGAMPVVLPQLTQSPQSTTSDVGLSRSIAEQMAARSPQRGQK